jgi:molybdenum cofactor cytidylyltransferase
MPEEGNNIAVIFYDQCNGFIHDGHALAQGNKDTSIIRPPLPLWDANRVFLSYNYNEYTTPMNIFHALRLDQTASPTVLCFTGSGGKTTAMFQAARSWLGNGLRNAVYLAATSHLGVWQIPLADHHIMIGGTSDIRIPDDGIVLFTGEIENDKTKPVNENFLNWIHVVSQHKNIPLLIEADGSRQKPLKAPAEHEPPIPGFADVVVHVSGLSALGEPLDDEHVHRAEIFFQLTGLAMGEIITPEILLKYLAHPQGALKNIPQSAKRIVLLNQADTPGLLSTAGKMARDLLNDFDAVIVGSLQQENLHLAECTAGIVLAAGTSSRYGQPKQLLDWNGKPFIRHVTETALRSGLDPVVVVTGYHHAEVESHLPDLPIKLIRNPGYAQGQASSIKAGLSALPHHVGAAIFLLADQPQIPVEVIHALTEQHASERQSILAPLVLEERRANPVLFDRITFPDLMQLQGDIGGRGIFDKHPVSYLPWHDDILLFDVDKPEDFEKLKRGAGNE